MSLLPPTQELENATVEMHSEYRYEYVRRICSLTLSLNPNPDPNLNLLPDYESNPGPNRIMAPRI